MRIARVLGPALVVVAGACRSAVPPAAATSPLEERIDRAARACARVASCAHPHDAPGERDPGACVDAWLARSPADLDAFASCAASARGCGLVDACVRARGDASATAYCAANAGAHTACDGDRLVTCLGDDPAENRSTDCASFGARCGETKQPGGLLSRGCLSPLLCPSGAPEVRCEGPRAVVACREGAVERTDCSGAARCEEHHAADGTLSAICEPAAHDHCAAVGKRWCDDRRLVQCQPHGPFGEMTVTDCAALGMGCDARGDTASCVVPGTRACERSTSRCDSGALAFCAAGRPFRVPCTDIGFAGCDPDAHGVDAACATAHPPAPAAPPR